MKKICLLEWALIIFCILIVGMFYLFLTVDWKNEDCNTVVDSPVEKLFASKHDQCKRINE